MYWSEQKMYWSEQNMYWSEDSGSGGQEESGLAKNQKVGQFICTSPKPG